ncbi:MAG: YibE/F family protein, partial [Sporichthyaceae bacterium]|nr:YibE/F family protein [Sporichthyaceae bacterium]
MILLWPAPPAATGGSASPDQVRVTADVLVVTETPCPGSTGSGAGATRVDRCGTVTVTLTDGPDRGRQVVAQIPVGPGAPVVAPGDDVVLVHTPDAPSALEYQIVDHQRGQQLWLLALAAALVVVGFGRWRGLASLGGLAVTFAILLIFIVPAILNGQSPLLVAIVGSAAIMLLVLYLTHGFNRATSVAVLGTLASLTLTGLLAAATTATLHLTGVGTSEEGFLTATFQNVNMQGLLLAGILIGTLGVLDDVAVTQAVTVEELAAANPATSTVGLYRAASRVGRAHIASVVNTIVLAYAGASLPLLLLFS